MTLAAKTSNWLVAQEFLVKPSVKGPEEISRKTLQSAITEAVKKSDPGCQLFVGVIVERTTPKSRFDANWEIKGIKFGKANRDKCSQALATIVERMQREFGLFEDPLVGRSQATLLPRFLIF
jgi:hypothetical protein